MHWRFFVKHSMYPRDVPSSVNYHVNMDRIICINTHIQIYKALFYNYSLVINGLLYPWQHSIYFFQSSKSILYTLLHKNDIAAYKLGFSLLIMYNCFATTEWKILLFSSSSFCAFLLTMTRWLDAGVVTFSSFFPFQIPILLPKLLFYLYLNFFVFRYIYIHNPKCVLFSSSN